jgi:hypothetical protein
MSTMKPFSRAICPAFHAIARVGSETQMNTKNTTMNRNT